MEAQPLEYRRLRAPRENGAVFADPPLRDVGETIRHNRPRARQLRGKVGTDLTDAIREEVLRLAIDYTADHCNSGWVRHRTKESPWIVTGHQPELYHPGVWIKNFALSALAEQQQAIPLNLVVDNDLCADCSLRVPVQDVNSPANPTHATTVWRQDTIPWDHPSPPVPFEERYIADADLFQSFLRRIEAASLAWSERPLIRELSGTADRFRREGRPVGECFARARHAFETTIVGLRTLEVPLGRVFDLPVVRQWMSEILNELPSLHAVYNSALEIFRKRHRIRSRSHPVPNLATNDDWLESPFWVWSRQTPQRRPLWTRCTAGMVHLSDGQQWRVSAADFGAALDAAGSDHRIRPRALTTTLFARTVLGDLFIHGIGGAKYDQLTDAIILNFFELPPPKFLTLTATIRLQDPPIDELERDVRILRHELRDLEFNPQRHLAITAETTDLLQKKAGLLGQNHDLASRHQELKTINAALQPWVEPQRQRALQELTEARAALQQARIFGSREYSLACHDAEELPRQLLDLCQISQ